MKSSQITGINDPLATPPVDGELNLDDLDLSDEQARQQLQFSDLDKDDELFELPDFALEADLAATENDENYNTNKPLITEPSAEELSLSELSTPYTVSNFFDDLNDFSPPPTTESTTTFITEHYPETNHKALVEQTFLQHPPYQQRSSSLG